MKELLKDYGAFIGPFLAFTLGILALYIKSQIDKQIDKSKSESKMKKLIKIIKETKPPQKYFEKKSENFMHADEARNLTNLTIYKSKFDVILAFMNSIENDILINCATEQIMQFYELKFISEYSIADINNLRTSFMGDDKTSQNRRFEKYDHYKILDNHKRLLNVCENSDVADL
jgi:hypothetical protein